MDSERTLQRMVTSASLVTGESVSRKSTCARPATYEGEI